MIDFNKLTQQTQNTVMAAQNIMMRFNNGQLLPEHLLLAMMEDEKGFSVTVFNKLNANISLIKEQTEQLLATKPKLAYPAQGQIYISMELKNLFDMAEEEAKEKDGNDQNIQIKGLLPLWYDKNTKKYLFFGGEYMENIHFWFEPAYFPLILKHLPRGTFLYDISPPPPAPAATRPEHRSKTLNHRTYRTFSLFL